MLVKNQTWIPLCILLFLVSCSMKSMAPTIGAGLGATAGLPGGPGGMIVGGTLGAGVGQLVHELDRNEKLSAISRGDVEELIKIQAEEQKGWFSQALDGLKSILILSGVAFALWNLIPLVYTRHIGKKIKQRENE